MGMDYMYSGSASYPRFDSEISSIARLFGGTQTKDLKERKQKSENGGVVEYMFGYMYGNENDSFYFENLDGINSSFVKWVNNPYEDLSFDETVEVFEVLKTKESDVKEISSQVYDEFEMLCSSGFGWSVL